MFRLARYHLLSSQTAVRKREKDRRCQIKTNLFCILTNTKTQMLKLKKKHLDFVLYNLYSYISCLQTAEMTRHSRSYVTGPRTRAPNAPEI